MDEKQIPWKWLKKGNGPIVLAQLTVKPLMVIFFTKEGEVKAWKSVVNVQVPERILSGPLLVPLSYYLCTLCIYSCQSQSLTGNNNSGNEREQCVTECKDAAVTLMYCDAGLSTLYEVTLSGYVI